MDYQGVVVRFLQGQKIFVFPKTPKTAVGSPRLLFSGCRGLFLREEADHSPPSITRLRMSGVTSPLPLKPSWRAQGHLDTWSTYWVGALLQNKTTQRKANKPRFLNGIVGLLRRCTVTVVGTSKDERTRLTEQRGKCHRNVPTWWAGRLTGEESTSITLSGWGLWIHCSDLTNHLTNKPTNKPTSQPEIQTAHQPANLTNQPTTNQPTKPTIQPANQSTN